jgi:membrane protease YdiL (CAAX protease family)
VNPNQLGSQKREVIVMPLIPLNTKLEHNTDTDAVKRYLILTFSITYLFWGATALLSAYDLYVHPSYNIGASFYIIAVCSPAISTYIIFQKKAETKGIQYFFKFVLTAHRLSKALFLFVVFIIVRFAPPLFWGDLNITGSWWKVIAFTPVMLFFGGLEEVGWRGYLQPKLENRFGFIVATLVFAIIWALWHVPLCFIQGTYQYSNSYLWFIVSLTGTAFSLAAIRRVAGNIFVCILFHTALNAITGYGISVPNGMGVIIPAVLQIVLAIIIVFSCERRMS